MQVKLNALQTPALRGRMMEQARLTSAANAAQAIVESYVSAILEGLLIPANAEIKNVDVSGVNGTITLEIKDAKTEGRTEEDRELD